TCSASSTRPSGSNSSSSGRRRSRAAASNDMRVSLPRATVIGVTALAVFLPLGLIFYQSLLNAPFFMPTKVGSGAFEFIFADSDFWDAFKNSLIIAAAMALIAVPLGGILAFLMVRTDLPGRTWIEPLLLIPVFVSPMVLAF